VFKGTAKKRDVKQKLKKKGTPKWKNVVAECELLEKRIPKETPPHGVAYYRFRPKEEVKEAEQGAKVIDSCDKTLIKIRFNDLPISKCTINGLFKAKFTKMTEVQRTSLPHSVGGRDMICCARTGSGKTLCYLIPVVEILYRKRWSMLDGLGALILVPTRELGM